MIGWIKYNLEDVSEFITKGATPTTFGYKWVDKGVPFLRSECVTDDGFNEKGIAFISVQAHDAMERSKVIPNDILISITGNVGRVAVFPKIFKEGNINQHIARVRVNKSDFADRVFIYYQLVQPSQRHNYNNIVTGAAYPQLSLKQIRETKILLPPLPTQRRIASILSAYDDLIENNLKRIKLLEELAQRTYEEWFVKFRIHGEQLPIDEKTGLPEGWSLKPFEELVDFKEGPGLRNTQYRDYGIPFLNIRVIKEDEVDFSKVQFLDPLEVKTKYPHFLLQENDHVISTSGTLGRLVTIRKRHLPLCLNTSLIRMRKKSDRYGTWLIKHTLSNYKFIDTMEAFANGSAQKNFGPIHLKQIKLLLPTKNIATAFESFAEPIELLKQKLKDQIIDYRQSRDILLPRLMSGKINVE
jgi:type I restriction enzyme S subunit